MNTGPADAGRAAERAARHAFGRLVALAAARTRNIAAAEEAVAEAFRIALETWPRTGVPSNPEAWLLVTARRLWGRGKRHEAVREAAARHLELMAEEAGENAMHTDSTTIPDERLRLMFVCAHPAIPETVRTPLMLQTVLGYTAEAMAPAFLVPPATMGQRLSRAKTKIREAGIPFALPERDAMPERLDSVLEAIYGAYTLDRDDPGGNAMSEETLWLARLIHGLLPGEAEAAGLRALIACSHARRAARKTPDGAYVPLAEQDTALWDAELMAEADRALSGADPAAPLGRFRCEAAIQSVHAARRITGRTDHRALVTLYRALVRLRPTPSAVAGLAASLSAAGSPHEALSLLDEAMAAGPADYQPFWAVKADALSRTGDAAGAAAAAGRAAALSRDPAVRRWLAHTYRLPG